MGQTDFWLGLGGGWHAFHTHTWRGQTLQDYYLPATVPWRCEPLCFSGCHQNQWMVCNKAWRFSGMKTKAGRQAGRQNRGRHFCCTPTTTPLPPPPLPTLALLPFPPHLPVRPTTRVPTTTTGIPPVLPHHYLPSAGSGEHSLGRDGTPPPCPRNFQLPAFRPLPPFGRELPTIHRTTLPARPALFYPSPPPPNDMPACGTPPATLPFAYPYLFSPLAIYTTTHRTFHGLFFPTFHSHYGGSGTVLCTCMLPCMHSPASRLAPCWLHGCSCPLATHHLPLCII